MELIPYSISEYSLEFYLIRISSRSKIIYWIITGMVTLGIAVLPFIYVDVTVQARGYFQSDIEKQVIYVPFQGRITYSSFRNGDRVEKGDTLLIIDSETFRAQQDMLIQRMDENNSSISDLNKLTQLDTSDCRTGYSELLTQRYRTEYANLRNQYNIQFQKYNKKRTEHERSILLFKQEIIPESDYENSLFLLNVEKDNLIQISGYQKTLWQSDLTARRIDSVSLIAEMEQCHEELGNRIIRVPASGEIIKCSDIQPGSIVSPGQIVAEISPDGNLIANCFVRPADIGLIHDNQKVKIQVDAYNYNEWGMINGHIIDISDDMILDNSSVAYFRIRCQPEQTFLELKNGHRGNIKKGMSLNARVIVIKRSLFNLLFDKADKWFNPYNNTRES